MRFLANENFPGDAVKAIIKAGQDVVWVRDFAPGAKDPQILAWAVRDSRVLLTFDKDFGHLARNAGLPAAAGVVLFRLKMPPPDVAGQRLATIVLGRNDWAGHFSVVEHGRVRMRQI